MAIQDFRGLKVWQAAMELATAVYTLTHSFPKSEAFGLSSQLQRAMVSIPSNIAEGHARDSTKEFLRFVSIAMGSLAEVETQLIIANNLNYIEENKLAKLLGKTGEFGRMLRGLQHSLKVKLPSP
jgi:four helix bundle protein